MNKSSITAHATLLSIILFVFIIRITLATFAGTPLANFSPLDAIALFSGAFYSSRFQAICVTLLSVWIGDIFMNRIIFDQWVFFYQGFYWQYAAYLLMVNMGYFITKHAASWKWLTASLGSSFLFFIISNSGVWLTGNLYPYTLEGLVNCYVAAIPFFKNTIMSDLFFTSVLLGSFFMIDRKFIVSLKKAH